MNGATVLFLACIVLHNPRACAKLLGMHCTGSLILRDLAHLDLSRFTTLDEHHSYWLGHLMDTTCYLKMSSTMRLLSRAMCQLILVAVGKSDVFHQWQRKSSVFPVHILLNQALKLAVPTVENSRPTHIILTRTAIAMGCALGASVTLLDQIIRKQTRQAQSLKSLSAVSLEWAENLLHAAPVSGGGNLQLSFGAMRQCIEDWLDAKLDDATQGLRTAIVHLNELLLRRIHYAVELLYPKAPYFRRRVMEGYLACLNRTFLLTLSEAQSCDFEVREFAVTMKHIDHMSAEWTVDRLVHWGLESQSELNKAIGISFFVDDHNYAGAIMAFLAAGEFRIQGVAHAQG